MRGRITGALLLAWALAAPPLGAPSATADEPTLGVQVNRAIERGVERIKKAQNSDGSYSGTFAGEFPVGQTALALYALAKAQVPAETPAVAKAVEYVRGRPLRKTYEVAFSILALDALKDPLHDEWIRAAAGWLEAHVNAKEGVWSYPFGATPNHSKTDLSNTQVAVLGLWAAEAHGYRAARTLWERLASVIPEYQAPYGGFIYSTNRGERESTGAMTTAGITVLTLALDRISGGDRGKPYAERAAKALAKGWEYLERRLTVDANPWGAYAFDENAHLYYLYGLERVAALADKARIAGHDWYRDGASALLGLQAPDGAWNGTTEDTCLSLLFLRKATATSMGREGPVLEGAGRAPPAPGLRKPANGVPFLRRWLLLGPFPWADDSGLFTDSISEAHLAPRAGERLERHTWTLWISPTPFVSFPEALGPVAESRSVSYAVAYLHAIEDVDVVLWLDHDDGARVHLDGRLIHESHFHRSASADRYAVPAHLARGPHRLTFKVENWASGTGFYCRVAHADGSEAKEVLAATSESALGSADVARMRPDGYSFDDLLRILPPDPRPTLDFGRPEDIDRVAIQNCNREWPLWLARAPSLPDRPATPLLGLLAVFPASPSAPARVIRRLRLPGGFPFVRLRISGHEYADHSIISDFVLSVSVFDGATHLLLPSVVLQAGVPAPDGWNTFDVDLRAYAGKDVLLVVEDAAGGKVPFWNEEAYIDEISVGTALR